MLKRKKAIHYDIYNQDEYAIYQYLKEYSGLKSDGEFNRWVYRELYRRLTNEEKDREAAREAISKGLVDIVK